MADLNYSVKVDTAQAQSAINTLRASIGGLATAVSIGAIVKFGDSITNLKNKLMALNPNVDTVQKQFAAIAAIADQSRMPLAAVGDLFFKIASSAQQLGISQKEAAQITDSLAKALAASGMSATEAAGPLLQLGQALQSGKFQGDELRSIMEGLPVVARALADSLGVPIGQLKKMGEQGLITGDVFVAAMRKAGASINEAFGATTPTIGQSLERIQTNLGKFFNNIEQNTGIFALLAEFVGDLADSVDNLSKTFKESADTLATVGKIVGALAASYLIFTRVLPAVVALQNALITAVSTAGSVFLALKNQLIGVFVAIEAFGKNLLRAFGILDSSLPIIGSLIAAFGALAKGILRFAGFVGIIYAVAEAVDFLLQKMNINFSIIQTLGDAWNWLKEKMGLVKTETEKAAAEDDKASDRKKRLAEAVNNATSALSDQATKLNYVAKATRQQVNEVNDLIDGYKRQMKATEDSIALQNQAIGVGALEQNLISNLSSAYKQYGDDRLNILKQIRDAETKGRNEQGSVIDPQELAKIPLLKKALADLDATYNVHIQTIAALTMQQEKLTQARQLEEFSIKSQQNAADELLKIQRDIADIGLTGIQKKYLDIVRAADDSAKAAIRAEEARRGNKPLDPQEVEEYYRKSRQGIDEVIRAQARLNSESRKFSTGWRQAWADYVDGATNAAALATRVFEKFTSGLEDAIVNFAKTGKFEWKKFVNDMAEELLRAQIKQTIASFGQAFGLGNLFGGGGGMGQGQGSTPNNPLYVIDLSGGGGAGAGGIFGGGGGSIFGNQGRGQQQDQGGGIFGSIGKVFGGVVDTAKSVFGGIGDAIGSIFGGGGGFGTGDLFGNMDFGGFFANGGTIPRGKYGIVGESGPEMIGGPATVTPLGSTNVTYNIQAVDAASFQALVARDPGFIHAVAMAGAKSVPQRR